MTAGDLSERLEVGRQIAAITTAFMLPLSTSGQAIAVSIFVVLAILTMDGGRFSGTIRQPAAYLPVLLFVLLLLGVFWSILPLNAAIKWVGPYAKLLLIPLVMASAFDERTALRIGYAFLAACLILLVLSWASLLWHGGPWFWFKSQGVPVKDNAVQSECFALCAFGLALTAIKLRKDGEHWRAAAVFVLAALFFTDIFMIYLSKTGMLVTLILLVLFAERTGGWRRVPLVVIPALVITAVAMWVSPPAQTRLAEMNVDIGGLNGQKETLSTASRLDFWSKAATFVREAPILGHGTGSIRPLYQSMEATRPSPYGEAVADPHNQFLHTVLQVGMIGGILLIAMWLSHFRLFLDDSIVSSLGLAVVLQNILGSLFNSHLSQVTQGMMYCLAVGLLGALILQKRTRPHGAERQSGWRPLLDLHIPRQQPLRDGARKNFIGAVGDVDDPQVVPRMD